MKKIVLAYSGGLDTSVAIKWLKEKYDSEVIALCVDVGEGKDLEFVKAKAEKIGAIKSYMVDAQEEFLKDYAFPALKANAMYEGVYPLSSGLSRPLICKLLVDVAKKESAFAVAHGCTGKGNDQVRFDVSVTALAPELEIIAPVREWPMSREEEIDYAAKNDIPIPIGKDNPFSIDQNLWGRSIECGVLEDPWVEPPEEAFEWTVSPEKAPNTPTYIEITFEKGIPIALDGKQMPPVELVKTLNKIAGQNGFGRIDHVENRLVGIKSRENYECPASLLLIKAHQDLEHLTLTKDVLHFKYCIEQKYAELIYDGLWFSPLKDALDAFIDKTQEVVNGTVRVKLFKGNAKVVGRKSPNSLYDLNLATYAEDVKDMFDHNSAKGFITLWGLPTKVNAIVNSAKASK
ncbi:argininosuccinate synthase [Biomaibacter acetigenes]|jgi:argininosuccinate synthase|uniref:Argininosuccinate synthase n=1 Tax=Biomaibacter acetigenes TaxID=2316383 RepID=A0A3G2R233_9FIRM|nr:argininosuccinate synthase [Biomaibacter acetigenes]AYO29490.1 argininosuccinate synthase [Biomaibacter acetigenes]MDN5313629.1 argininosuccinate synthase [Thermoanaerobacteraceae bacterium]